MSGESKLFCGAFTLSDWGEPDVEQRLGQLAKSTSELQDISVFDHIFPRDINAAKFSKLLQ